ncbi:unnamed protein product [Pleuronectes platessa]|uniref:Uncharacterized protein n=1 Tax=Pleuronectes platessa TaxID=8262 RepID=A0A9N7YW64_PLEPL|nr:unnamed protein product [Pleuronectes platessa]
MGSEKEGRVKTIIAVMNEGWWQEPSGDHSVTETGFCGPNFIIMTQSHQHTPSDESAAELYKESVKLVEVHRLVTGREDGSGSIQMLQASPQPQWNVVNSSRRLSEKLRFGLYETFQGRVGIKSKKDLSRKHASVGQNTAQNIHVVLE